MTKRSYAGGAVTGALVSGVNEVETIFLVDDLAGWPTGANGNFAAVIDKDTPSEEKVLCSENTGTALVIAARGYDGTTAVPHAASAIVQHVITSVDVSEPNTHINTNVGVHGLAAQDAVVGETKAQPLTNKTIDGGNNTIQNVPASASPELVAADAQNAADIASNAADIATLDSDLTAEANARIAGDDARYTKVEADARFTTDAEATTIAQGVENAGMSAHTGAADPHPTYLTQAEGDARYAQGPVAISGVTKIHFGKGTYTPNASGRAIVAHGAPFTPTGATCQINDDQTAIENTSGKVVNVAQESIGGANFSAWVFRNDNGNPVTSPVNLRWTVTA